MIHESARSDSAGSTSRGPRTPAPELKVDTLGGGRFTLAERSPRVFTMLVSGAVKQEEPQRFNESGLFLIATGGTSFYVAVNSMPFGRPRLADIRDAVDFVVEDTYPARGRRGGTQNPWLRPPDRTGPS